GRVTQSLFYATDFIDRLENEIMPALRAGFIVLTDRYIYSLMARAIVRGMDAAWIRRIYSVALVPDAVFYLRVGVEELIPRVVFSRGFDYWESGMDVFPGHDMYESFRSYQAALLAEFDRLSAEFNFETVDASGDVQTVFAQLKSKIQSVLESGSRAAHTFKPQVKPTLPPNHQFENPFVSALVASALEEPGFSFATAVANGSNGNGNGNGRGVLQQK
ncbi:MAG: dTMP kinase, partial [Chthoniobacterales bacterium]